MNQEKYIGMDVHAATISVAVKNAQGKLLMECVLETKAATILEFIQGLRGTLALTFEEGTLATWLHDLLKPHVSRLVVCDPRKNALLRGGNQNDGVDARNLAELLRTNQVHAVYHGKHGTRALKELGRSYLTLTQDTTRVMNRIKSVYRSWAIACAGTSVYSRHHRAEWLAQLVEPGVRIRAEHLYQQLDSLEPQCAVKYPPSRKIGIMTSEVRKSVFTECEGERSSNARPSRRAIPVTKLPSIPRLTNLPLPAAFVSCQYFCSI
jgi:transposase